MRKLNPVFLRYLMILFLFSALLLIVLVPLYFYIFDFTLNNELSYINDRFKSGVSSWDSAIKGVNNIAILTGGDSRFRIFSQERQNLAANPVMLNELRDHFNGLLFSHPVIMDAGIIFTHDVILTRQQIFFIPLLYPFYGNYIRCENLSMDEWFSFLTTNSLLPVQHYTSMSYGSYEGITYSVKRRGRQVSDINLVYAVLPVKNILSLLADDEILHQSSIRIFTNDGNTLYSYSGERWDPRKKPRSLTVKSEVSPAFFELMIPESVISGKMSPVKRLMFAFGLAAVFFALCLSLSFAYKWSEPMRRLLLNIDSTKLFKNEYEQNIKRADSGLRNYFRRFYTGISESINSMDNRLEDSLRTIEGQTSLLREQIFFKALYQGIYNEEDERLFRSLFAEFPAFFQLALINYDQPAAPTFQKTATAQLELINTVKNFVGSIFIQSIGDTAIILLLPVNEKDEFWYTELQNLRDSLNRQIDLPLHFSLSGIYERPRNLPRAWQEILSIHIASGVENLAKVGRINDIPNPQKRIPLNITALQMIYNALNNGSDDTACNILAECTVDLIRENDMFVLGLISNLLHDMLVLFKSENSEVLINEEIPQYIRSREGELFTVQFPECFRRIGKLIRQNKEESMSRFSSKILDFINENLYNPGLYSTMVQDHFNISQPTLQKLVKQVTGQTFLAYVETKRLDRARELLLEGVHTVQEISEKCGFSNTNSFYKAFKRMYGFPPSDIKAGR